MYSGFTSGSFNLYYFYQGEKIMDIKFIGILIVIFVVIDLIYWFITKGGHKNGNK